MYYWMNNNDSKWPRIWKIITVVVCDAAGGIKGGLEGSAFGPVGTVAGAIAGAVVTSAGGGTLYDHIDGWINH
jgi:hypothetical protein